MSILDDAVRDFERAEAAGKKLDPATIDLIRGCEVAPEPIVWAWNGYIANGKLHIMGGAPGTGKTTIALGLMATVTVGGRWPDGSRSPIGNVAIWSGEDTVSDTLIPRLIAAGADMNRVFIVGAVREAGARRAFDPSKDMESLQRGLQRIGDVRLLVIDSVVSAIAGDSHKNAETRRGLQPLTDLAAATDCAVLGITHFSKGTAGRDPLERINGSIAFGALARVVLVAAKFTPKDDEPAKRLLLRVKSNIGPDDGGFEYDLHQEELVAHPGVYASSVRWGASVDGQARDLLAEAEAHDEDRGAHDEAEDWLRDLLADGPLSAKEVKRQAAEAGMAWRTIERAKKDLGIKPTKTRFDGGWEWSIKPKTAKNAEDRQECQSVKVGGLGGLREDCPSCGGEGCSWCGGAA